MSSLLPITYYPDPFLRKQTRKVTPEDVPKLQGLIDDMILTMEKKDGIGIAAPQVGKGYRIFIVAHKDGPLALINPEFTKKSFRKDTQEEGCLSIPGVSGTVRRHTHVHFEAQTRDGKMINGKAEGLFARVLQHEMDHIDGILFIDRVIEITHGTLEPEKN